MKLSLDAVKSGLDTQTVNLDVKYAKSIKYIKEKTSIELKSSRLKSTTVDTSTIGEYLQKADFTLSETGQTYMNDMLNIANDIPAYIIKDTTSNETFDFVAFKLFASVRIFSIENMILNDKNISIAEKKILLASTSTFGIYMSDFEQLTLLLTQYSGLTKSLFSKIRRAVSKVASAVVSVVINVVVSAVTSFGNGYNNGNLLNAGICGIGGAISGFFSGIDRGYKCASWDMKCIMSSKNNGTVCNRDK